MTLLRSNQTNIGIGGGSSLAYIASMSAYQVRALSGSFAPTNGSSSISSVTPSEWQSTLAGVITAWSGGYKAISGTKLYVTGGGHTDGQNNGIYVFDYAGTTRPTGWTVRAQSTVANSGGAEINADGRPSAWHTYDGALYAHHNNKLYRFSGVNASLGGAVSAYAWEYDPTVADTSAAWTRLPDYPDQQFSGGKCAIYDPTSGNILVLPGTSANPWYQGHFFRTAARTWSGAKALSLPFDLDASGALDTSRGRFLAVGASGPRLTTVNFSTETVSVAAQSLSSSVTSGMCMFYDAARDVYWAFGDADWTHLYEINASTFAVTSHTLTGDAISVMAQSGGSYGRYVFLSSVRAIGTVASTTSPAYVIKLP